MRNKKNLLLNGRISDKMNALIVVAVAVLSLLLFWLSAKELKMSRQCNANICAVILEINKT